MSDNPDETAYYLRLVSMYMDLGTETVHDVFVYHSPGKDPHTFLKSKEETLIKLKNRRILNQQQWELLLEKDTSGKFTLKYRINLQGFDISLLTTLAINLFTNVQLPPPRKGWDNPPRNSDKSIAADLLRLRTLRNVIVGHHPRARLSQDRFEEEWQNVSEILLRIQQKITQGNGALVQERIELYYTQPLDHPCLRNKYYEKLRDWLEDVSKMQDKVEDLLRKLDGFDAYFKNKCDWYDRYTMLLVKGGRFVLSSFLDERIKKQGRDLRSILDENKETIQGSIKDSKHLDVLYPSETNSQASPSDISLWNVSILAAIIQQLFDKDIGRTTKRALQRIGDAYRNYAENALIALDSNAFVDFFSDLKASLENVSENISEEHAAEYYQILDDSKKKIEENDFQTYMDELMTQGTQIKSFTDIFKETLQKTKDCLQDMITHGISFKTSHVLELKMITIGNAEEKKQVAENILSEIWHEALNRSMKNPGFSAVKKEVEKILHQIRKSKSVENITIIQACIILQISCISPRDLLELINYFESSQFHESLNIISKELGYHFNTAFAIKAFIPVDNLWGILNHSSDLVMVKQEGIRVPISVSSPAGMLKLRSLFSSERIANSTNVIADALSKHFNETITLKVETDMKKFKNIFDEDNTGLDSSSDSSISESDIQNSSQLNPATEPGKRFEEQSHTSCDEKPPEDKTETQTKTLLNDMPDISKDDDRKVLIEAAQRKRRTETDEKKTEAKKQKLELVDKTHNSGKEIEKRIEQQRQLSMPEPDKASSYAVDDIEEQTIGSVRQLQAHKQVTVMAAEGHTVEEKAKEEVKKIKSESDAIVKKVASEIDNAVRQREKGMKKTESETDKAVRQVDQLEIEVDAVGKTSKAEEEFNEQKDAMRQVGKKGFNTLESEVDAEVKMGTSKAEETLYQIQEKLQTGDEDKYSKRKSTVGFHTFDWEVDPGMKVRTSKTEEALFQIQKTLSTGDEDKYNKRNAAMRQVEKGFNTFGLEVDPRMKMLTSKSEEALHPILKTLPTGDGDKYSKRKAYTMPFEPTDDKIMYGQCAYELYRKGLEYEGEYSSIRVNVVGHFGQGKTSLVARLLRKDIKGLESTKGIDISLSKYQQDVSGNIRYEENSKLDSSVVAKRIGATAGLTETIPGLLKKKSPRGQMWKTDTPKRMSEKEKKTLIQIMKAKYETSTCTSDNIRLLDICDFGGGYAFYATHTLFHSKEAVYLLVFNLTSGLKDTVINDEEECCVDLEERTMEYYIKLWVNSIHFFVGDKYETEPKIILVGTHKDQLEGDAKSKQKQANEYFDDIRSLFRGKPVLKHIYHEDFALDNKSSEDNAFDSLRNAIQLVGKEYAKFISKPAKWIELEQSLFCKRHDEIVDFAQVVQIDSESEFPLGSEEDIKLFLQHQHEQGKLFYFDEEPKSQHVVLDPKFLVDAFKCLITANRFVRNRADVYENWQNLSKKGKLETHLIDKLWGSENAKFITHKNTLLWFLQKHRIISEVMQFDETKQAAIGLGWYVVPSLLKDRSKVAETKEFLKGKTRTKIQFVISFDNSSIVPIVYHRLTAAVLGKWPVLTYRDKTLLFQNMSVVRIDGQHAGIIEMNDSHIHLYVLNLCPPQSVNNVIPDTFRRFAERAIMYEFRKYRSAAEDLPYQHGYTCNHESHDMSGKHVKQFAQQDESVVEPCTENGAHSIYVTAAKAEWFQGNQRLQLISSDTLSNKTIARLSNCIGDDWEILAAALHIPRPEVERTKLDYPYSTGLQIYKILLSWRDEFAEEASLSTLVQNLQSIEINVNWDGIRNIVDDQNRSERPGSAH